MQRRRWWRRALLPSLGVLGSTMIALRSNAGTFEIAIFGQQPRLSAVLLTTGFMMSGASAVGLIASRELVADAQDDHQQAIQTLTTEKDNALEEITAQRQDALEEIETLHEDNDALVQQIDYLQSTIEEYADDVLVAFLHAAELGTTARISLFAVEYRNAQLVSRHSLNPELQTAARRPYPLNKGAIGQAYKHGVASEARLPPTKDLRRWNKAQAAAHRLDLDTASLLRLRPRSYLIVRLDDPEGTPVGLVALESESPKEIDAEVHGALLSQGWSRVLAAVLMKIAATSSDKDADPQLARMEGY